MELTLKGVCAIRQIELLRAYDEYGFGSARNIEELRFGDTSRQLWKRAPELVQMGLLEDTGLTEISITTFRPGKIRRITSNGRDVLRAISI